MRDVQCSSPSICPLTSTKPSAVTLPTIFSVFAITLFAFLDSNMDRLPRGALHSVEIDLDREGRIDTRRWGRERRCTLHRIDRRLVELRLAARAGNARALESSGGADAESDRGPPAATGRGPVTPDGSAHRCRVAA